MIDWLEEHGYQVLAALAIVTFWVAPMVIYAALA